MSVVETRTSADPTTRSEGSLLARLAPGYELPPLPPEHITRERVLHYAGASGDFNPMHVDEVMNTESGMGGIFAHGMLGTGFLGRVVTDHLGDVPLTAFVVRCTELVRPGDTLMCTGKVTDRRLHDRSATVRFSLKAVNQEQQVTHEGWATVEIPFTTIQSPGGKSVDEAVQLVRWRAIG